MFLFVKWRSFPKAGCFEWLPADKRYGRVGRKRESVDRGRAVASRGHGRHHGTDSPPRHSQKQSGIKLELRHADS